MRGVANDKKRVALFDYHRKNADFLIFQETHSTTDNEAIWENQWGGKAIFAHGTSAARGIAVFMKREQYSKIKNITKCTQGRYIIFDLQQDDENLTIVALYAPNEDNPAFFKEIAKNLESRHEHKLVIGDFNLTLNVDLDRLNTYSNNSKAKEEVENMMDEFILKDIWRERNESARQYSWHKKSMGQHRKASRIDLALISAGLDQRAEMIMYITSIKTDHRAIYLVLEMKSSERGTGYWKFNNKLLLDKDFVQWMNLEISLTLECTTKDPSSKWEHLKERIKKSAQKYARKKASEQKLIISQLSEIVNNYEEQFPLKEEEDQIYQESKTELEEILLEKSTSIMYRSKVRWHELGEKSTKYFYSLEKARYNAKTCYKIINSEQQEVTKPDEILEEQRKFYQELYSKDEDVQFTLENNTGITVPQEIQQQQDIQISLDDIKEAIKGMKNNKTPGEDGIPIDFYKVFWSKIQHAYMEMIYHCFNKKQLNSSTRRGILNLIPKPNKDTRQIKNLRPITLLNSDYKIIEKAIANKMSPALKHIIHQDQRGFMKDRRISVNIRKLLDIIEHAKQEDLEAVVLSLDFVKCFDKCSFSILHGSLEFFNFGNIVKEWTKILYTNFVVAIQNNGFFSKEIQIKKGVHQGGCCSSIYFLVIAEILALSIRNNTNIDGISIGQIKNLLNQFADDMDIASLCNEKSIREIQKELQNFKLQSGFTVSYEKTTMYRIGSLRHSNAQMYNMDEFVWSNQDINVLGVTIAHENLTEKNYHGIVEKTKSILNAWYNRGLSLIGKIQVVNTLIASLFVYKMMVFLVPYEFPYCVVNVFYDIIKNIDNTIREFIWNKKKS